MTNHPTDAEELDVAVSPTLGKIDDLQSAAEAHRHSDDEPKSGGGQAPYDEDDVTGGPTLGSIKELRFAHHAHNPEQPQGEATTDG